ncbi:MAG: AsmA family protein [Acidisphaera sp.]|nr:AsmA family protein [Acidisphaera sp.]
MARIARILLGGFLALLALAVGAVWLLPGVLDWNRYRDSIASLASAELGRPVSIEGPVTLTLLPRVVLTAARVAVADAGDGVAMTAQSLRLRVALGPLLSGRIDARELVLHRPDVRLPWPMAPAALVRRPDWLASLSAHIEDGRLSVGGVSFSGIEAVLSAGSDSGGYAAAGTAMFSGRPWRFTGRLTGAGSDGAAGLDMSLDGQGPTQGMGATFSGRLAADGALAGRIAARGPDLSQLLPAPPLPFRAEGRLTLAAGLAAADDLTIQIGGSPARGAVALRVAPAPRLDVALASSRLDLDAWLPVLLRGAAAYPVGLDLSAEAAQLHGGLLRRVRAAFDFRQGVAEIREAGAVLPGDASLHLTGRITLATRDRKPHFEGSARLAAPDLRTTLHWLATSGVQPLEELPAGVLRSAALTATAFADPDRVALAGLTGEADGNPLSGTLSVAFGARIAIAAGLAMDRLDLDPWLPATLPGPADASRLLAPFDADLQVQVRRAQARGVTIEDLSVDAVAARGALTLRRLAGSVLGGAGQRSGAGAGGNAGGGVHAELSGSVAEDGRISDGRLELTAGDASPVAALLPASRLPAVFWHAPARLRVEAAGPPEALGLRIGLDFGDARLEATPTVNLPAGTWSGPLTLRHPGAPRLLQALGLADPQAWIGDGSLSLISQLAGGGRRVNADSFDLTAGALHATGKLALDAGGPEPQLTGALTADTLPLPGLALRSPDPLPLGALRGWRGALRVQAAHVLSELAPAFDQATATVTLDGGVLALDGLAARLGGGALTGSARLDGPAEPPTLSVQAELRAASLGGPIFDLPLDVSAGVLDGSAALQASGHSPAAMLATLGGALHISGRSGAIDGFNMSGLREDLRQSAADDALAAALAGGTSGFDRLEVGMSVARGILGFDEARLSGPDGTTTLSGSIDLPGAAFDLHALLRAAVPDAPEVGLRLTGPFAAPRRTPELADVARWRTRERASQTGGP